MNMNEHFKEFISAIQPTPGQEKLVKEELDFLEKKLKEFISDEDKYHLVKVLRSGSYAKNTLLKQHAKGDFDADVAIYITAVDDENPNLLNLLNFIEVLLKRAYKNRTERPPTFDRSTNSAVKVKFEDPPKINIDVVPVIDLPDVNSIPNWGAIPRRDGELRNTSVTEHIEQVRARNKVREAVPFNHLLMIFKWWRNHVLDESLHDKFSSFALEVMMAKAFDETEDRLVNDWLPDLLTVGTWILRHRFEEPIEWEDARVPNATENCSDPYVLFDPLNKSNNLAHDWNTADVKLFLNGVARFCDVLDQAQLDMDEDETKAVLVLDQVLHNFSNWSN